MPNARILIVEDEGLVAKDLENTLRRLDYEPVGIAFSGLEAIAIAERTKPDLVFMDIRLKGEMDGIQAAAVMRERLHTAVIFLTAHADTDTVRRAATTEPYGYVIKPFDEKSIRPAVEIALYRQRIEQPVADLKRRLDKQSQELAALWKVVEGRFDKDVTLVETFARLRGSVSAYMNNVQAVMDQMEREINQAQVGVRSIRR